MTDPKNLKVRVKKARAGAVHFAKVEKKDRVGNVSVVLVPGSNGKRYQVIIRRYPPNVLTAECRMDERIGMIPCRGNGSGSTCVHSLTAIIVAAREKGCEVAWCATKESASQVARLGGKRIEVKPHHKRGNSNCSVWAVVKKKE